MRISHRPRGLRVVAIVLTLAAALGSCRNDEPGSGPPIRVGGIFTLHGEYRDTTALDGVHLAIREINALGGVSVDGRRRPIDLLLTDDQSKPPTAVARANELINQRGIAGLLGPVKSSLAIPVGAVAERGRVPMITPGSTNPATTRGRRFVYRTIFTDDVQGEIAAGFAVARLHARRAAVHYEVSSPYSAVLAEAFSAAFERRGGRIVSTTTYTVDMKNPTRGIGRLAGRDIDVLFLPNTNVDAGQQGMSARRAGIDAVLLGSDSWDLERYARDPEFAPSYATSFWAPEVRSRRSAAFASRFTRAYGRPPGAYEATAYDAVGLLVEAIERAGSADSEAIGEQLDAITSYEGVTWTLQYGRGGDPRTGAVVLRGANGQEKLDTVIPPEDVGAATRTR